MVHSEISLWLLVVDLSIGAVLDNFARLYCYCDRIVQSYVLWANKAIRQALILSWCQFDALVYLCSLVWYNANSSLTHQALEFIQRPT